MDLEDRRLAWIDPDLLDKRHEALAKGLELLLRLPDLAHPKLAIHVKAHVVLQAVRRPLPLLKTTNGFVVLLRGRGRFEAGKNAHGAFVWLGGRDPD